MWNTSDYGLDPAILTRLSMTIEWRGVCVWSVWRTRGCDPVPTENIRELPSVVEFRGAESAPLPNPVCISTGQVQNKPTVFGWWKWIHISYVLLLSSRAVKAAVRVGGFTLPPQTASGCLLGLFISFSTMQGCSEPIASQLNQQNSFLIFLGGKLRNLAPLGAHGFFVAWPQKRIVFSCVSMPVLSSILAAAAKSRVREKGCQKSPARRGQSFGLVQFRPKFSSGLEAAPATHRLCLHCMRKVWAAGKVAWLISSCCHPSLAPAWAAVQGGPTHGWSLGNLEQDVPPQWVAMWLEEGPAAWPACSCSTA